MRFAWSITIFVTTFCLTYESIASSKHRSVFEKFKRIIVFSGSAFLVENSFSPQPFRYSHAIEEIQSGCTTDTNAQVTVTSCRKLGLVKNRLRGCDANENCISTSSKAASKYGPPWTYGFIYEKDPSYDPFTSLISAAIEEGLTILRAEGNYILAAEKNVPNQPSGSSLFYEFLIKDGIGDKVVLYRAVVDKTVFLYPLQQPVSDFGALQSRLEGVLHRTGWLKIGE